jgi:CSLREA domain-containing protein
MYLLRRIKSCIILLFLLTAFIGGAVNVTSVSAAVIVVNTNADNTIAGDDHCTLREAINNANSTSVDTTGGDCAVGSELEDQITFSENFTITLDGARLPGINSTITIIGKGATNTIIEASSCNPVDDASCTHTHNVFEVLPDGVLTLEGITVRHGVGTTDGGGILINQGSLTINNSIISDNKATFGGGICNYAAGLVIMTDSTLSNNKATSYGGGIWNASVVTLTGIILTDNDADLAGGGLYNSSDGAVSISGGEISGNTSDNGGGISNYGALNIADHATLTNNNTQISGGGIANGGNGTVNLTDSFLSNNSALSIGGGLYSSGGQINIGNSDLVGNTAENGAGIYNLVEMSILGGVLSGNNAGSYGGGILNIGTLTIAEAAIYGNTANYGGAITNSGILSLEDTRLYENVVGESGGGIYSHISSTMTLKGVELSDNRAKYGGGICHNSDQPMTVLETILSGNIANEGGGIVSGSASIEVWNTITDSTLYNNSATNIGGGILNFANLEITNTHFEANTASNDSGGAIFTDGSSVLMRVDKSNFIGNTAFSGGGIINYSNLEISDSTFSWNTAFGSYGHGGGIYNQKNLVIINSTFSGNVSVIAGGGIANSIFGSLRLINNTLSDNSANGDYGGGLYNLGVLDFTNTIIANSKDASDCYYDEGTIGINLHNLVEDGSCHVNGIGFLSGDPMLHDLGNNGGPTLTHALKGGSPAIDAADPAYCPLADQRGVTRPQGVACDIGAFEFEQGSAIFLPLILK